MIQVAMMKQLPQNVFLIVSVLLAALHLQSTLSSEESSIHFLRLTGYYSWELIVDVDNSENSETVNRKVQINTSVFCSYNTLRHEIKNYSAGISTEFGVSALFSIINIGVKGQINSTVKVMYESMSEIHSELRTESTKTKSYEVGPYSKLKIYRQVFNGPGIIYMSDTTSSTPREMDDVKIDLTLKIISFLRGISVVYTSDSASRPSNLISEVNGRNADINGGLGGSYVWLVARWTTKPEDAVTGIRIVVQDKENNNYTDLSKGAGGPYRYIKMQKDSRSTDVITEIGLYRASTKEDDPCDGWWQLKSEDINSKRGKDYLYLVWNKSSL